MNFNESIEDEYFNASQTSESFAIIGIAVSPMKLGALEQFFNHMIPTSGLAFVIALHGAGKKKKIPVELLSIHTTMKIHHVQDNIEILPNCIYLMPPNVEFRIRSGKILFKDTSFESDQMMLADQFMTAFAESLGSKTICILLSDGGVDGARGIEAITQVNGMVMVEAKTSSLPVVYSTGNEIETDQIYYALTPQEMPWHILEYIKFYTNHTKESIEEERATLFDILKQATGVDFGLYKQASVLRRIQRRMGLQGFQILKEYNQFLCEHSEEVAALQKDLLIGVTHFFRDPDAFATLAEKVVPLIFEQRLNEKQVRIWVAGCSTGEEVYSLAMLFKQYLDEVNADYNVKIFATDLDKDSIQFASRGIYPETILKNVSTEQLTKYFTVQGSEYRVNKDIRQMIVFAQHNILKDPPFIQLDLVTCRNMLIYLQPDMQRKVISLFHFALKSDAFLFLGPSETLGKLTHLFKPIESKWNIYQYKEMNQWLSTNSFGMGDHLHEKNLGHKNKVIARLKETDRILKLDNIYTKLIEDYVSSCIIIDENNEIIHINGNASQYLTIPKGKPSHNLFKMISEQLSVALRTALHKVRKEQTEVIYRHILLKESDGVQAIKLSIKPFQVNSTNDKLSIIFFEEVTEISKRVNEFSIEEEQDQLFFYTESNISQHIKDLEQELFHAKESLQANIEELETLNEEFQASNEELIVANEELQSTNEELQSVNEELMAVNNEYQYKIQELTEVNNDISNFFISTNIATIFLDTRMNIRKFTPAITNEINVMEMDIGRPLADISHYLKCDHLVIDARRVSLTGESFESEVQSTKGNWYKIKIAPYRSVEQENKGVVITLIDISELKKMNEELYILSYAIQQSPGCIAITDMERNIKYINTKYTEQTGFTLEDLVNTKLELFSDNFTNEELLSIWRNAALGKKWVGELLNKKKTGEIYSELVSLLPITNHTGEHIHFLKISEDITDQKHTLELLHKSDMLSVVGQLAAGIAHEIRNPLTALKGFTKLMAPNTEKKHYIEIMTSELNRIESIISELLILAKPQQLNFEKQDVLAILQDVIVLLEAQANLNNVEIVTKFSDAIPMISCVRNQLKQVFINVLKNGIESMSSGGHLIVKVKKQEENKVLISFTDQGVGIPESKIPKLGDPFYSTKENGTGLGLMVSYKIIENHQGSIAISSVLGKGSTFDITLNSGDMNES